MVVVYVVEVCPPMSAYEDPPLVLICHWYPGVKPPFVGTPAVKVTLVPAHIVIADAEIVIETVNNGLTVIVKILLVAIPGFAHTSEEAVITTVILSLFTNVLLVYVEAV